MRERFKAFAVHFALSALVALLMLSVVFLVWYPVPLTEATGALGIVGLIVLALIVLGPVLTFAVYQRGKKSLTFDLAVIVLIQLAALAYGVFTLAEGRPVWLVYSTDRFDVVRMNELDTRYAERVKPEYQSSMFSPPRWVAALPTDDAQENSTVTLEAAFAGLDYAQRPYLYHPLPAAADSIQKHAQALDTLQSFNPPEQVAKQLSPWPEADAWLPLMATSTPMVVLIKRETAEVVAVVDLHPWKDE